MLSCHMNVTTHVTSIVLTEIMMNKYANKLIKMPGRSRMLEFIPGRFKPQTPKPSNVKLQGAAMYSFL